MTATASAAHEAPVLFDAGGDQLYGILTRPTGPARGIGIVLLSGGEWTPSPGRNRIWVRLARELAATGYHVLRFDYHGVGESTGAVVSYTLSEPFVDDVVAAAAVLEQDGAGEIVLLGTCFGARSAMAAAPRLANLRGVGFFPAPVREFEMGEQFTTRPATWYLRRVLRLRAVQILRDRERRAAYIRLVRKRFSRSRPPGVEAAGSGYRWVSRSFVTELGHLVDRRLPVLLVFGRDDAFYEDFTRGRTGPLGKVLDAAGPLVEVAEVDGKVHGLTRNAVQDDVLAVVRRWLAERA